MKDSNKKFETMTLKSQADYNAPDGSEIRLLPTMNGGGLCHCTLLERKTSSPVAHRQAEESWYFIQGEGEIWLKSNAQEETTLVTKDRSVTIPPRTSFQFRNTGKVPLYIPIATMPPWPGPEEAYSAQGKLPESRV